MSKLVVNFCFSLYNSIHPYMLYSLHRSSFNQIFLLQNPRSVASRPTRRLGMYMTVTHHFLKFTPPTSLISWYAMDTRLSSVHVCICEIVMIFPILRTSFLDIFKYVSVCLHDKEYTVTSLMLREFFSIFEHPFHALYSHTPS